MEWAASSSMSAGPVGVPLASKPAATREQYLLRSDSPSLRLRAPSANGAYYAADLFLLQRYEEARSLLRKVIPVARRFLGENDDATLRMRWVYARALYEDPDAALKDLRKVVKTLEELAPTARQVFGGAHPLTTTFEKSLRDARAALADRETPDAS